MRNFDILIVGNGILAYSAAYALMLEDPRLRIGIIGPYDRLWGATPASGAMLGCFGELTGTYLQSEVGRQKFEMAREATEMWPDWLNGINEYVDTPNKARITPGTFVILNAKSGILEDENYCAIKEALIAYQQKFQEIDPRTIPGLDPVEDCRPLRAMYLPDEGSVSSAQVLANLQYFAECTENIHIIEGLAKTIQCNQGVHTITLNNGDTYSAQKVVLAAGVKTQDLLDQLPNIVERIPRLFAGVGFSLITEQVGHKNEQLPYKDQAIRSVVRTPNRSFSCGLHIVPREDNSLYIGATNNAFLEPKTTPNMGDIHFLLECALEQINQKFERAEISSWKVGNRPMTADTYPLIGETSIDGLWLLTGTYREGLHLSPIFAQRIARAMLGKDTLQNNLFQPERRLISTMTKADAIAETVKHFMALGYEFSIRMPQTGWQDQVRDMLTTRVTTIYDQLQDKDFVLPPNLMMLVERHPNELLPYFNRYNHLFNQSKEATFI